MSVAAGLAGMEREADDIYEDGGAALGAPPASPAPPGRQQQTPYTVVSHDPVPIYADPALAGASLGTLNNGDEINGWEEDTEDADGQPGVVIRAEDEEGVFYLAVRGPNGERNVQSTGSRAAYAAPPAASEIAPITAMDALTGCWIAVTSKSSGDTYYKNKHTGETTWDKPSQVPPAGARFYSFLPTRHAVEAKHFSVDDNARIAKAFSKGLAAVQLAPKPYGHFEIRFKAPWGKLKKPPATGMCQVNLENQNTRVVSWEPPRQPPSLPATLHKTEPEPEPEPEP